MIHTQFIEWRTFYFRLCNGECAPSLLSHSFSISSLSSRWKTLHYFILSNTELRILSSMFHTVNSIHIKKVLPILYPIRDSFTNLYAELKISEFKPSIIAASAFLCAIHDLNAPAFSSSKSIISSCEYVDTVRHCIYFQLFH